MNVFLWQKIPTVDKYTELSIMIPHPLPHLNSPPWGYLTGFKGIFLASSYIYTWIEIHMQIIWGAVILRNWILLFMSSSSYFMHRYKYMYKSHSLEGWYSQLCTRNVMLILTAAAMSWVVRGDPLHQAASRSSASLLGLPHWSGWYPASLSMRNKTFNNLNFNLNYLPITLHLPVSC